MESGHEELQTRSAALSGEVAELRDALAAHATELAARDQETRRLVAHNQGCKDCLQFYVQGRGRAGRAGPGRMAPGNPPCEGLGFSAHRYWHT